MSQPRRVEPDHPPDHRPQVDPEDALLADDRVQLLAFVDAQRAEVLALLDGLDEAQVRARLVPSATTLLGLVKHCTFVERVWFPVSLEGRSRTEVGVPEDAEASWALHDADTIDSVRTAYLAACEESRALVASYDLDAVVAHNRRSPLSLRWVLLHLVRELARHAGHGDVLREQLLAQTAPSEE
ncbi:DinB family protein [Nocardioides flavescens]|uniref:DUF664 domain-containing protein n=1 Tax=Nocardioides flavescens TaxID=2691959 RepID=A0A6L7EXQ7_9ACTN|nr:DinB family protein [Nocardioides flavescens]MXG88182.1 DUF664 domain-containing protein [Nocardioides flavescens]